MEVPVDIEKALPPVNDFLHMVKDGHVENFVIVAVMKPEANKGNFLTIVAVEDKGIPNMVFSLAKMQHDMLNGVQAVELGKKRPDPNPNAL